MTTTITVELPVEALEAFLRVAPTDEKRQQLTDFNPMVLGRIQMREALAEAGVEPETVRPGHPRWEEFAGRLTGPEGCDFKRDPEPTWKCGGGIDLSMSEAILRDMYEDALDAEQVVQRSLAYFSANGGHCDCEVLFNVDEEPPKER